MKEPSGPSPYLTVPIPLSVRKLVQVLVVSLAFPGWEEKPFLRLDFSYIEPKEQSHSSTTILSMRAHISDPHFFFLFTLTQRVM